MSTLFEAPLAPYLEEKIEWPLVDEVALIQETAIKGGEKLPVGLVKQDGLHKNVQGAVWIPKDAVDLQLRLCVIGHCGRGGHRGASTTTKNLSEHFF